MIPHVCRYCDRDVQSPDDQAGSRIECPLCGRPIVVPAPAEVSPSARSPEMLVPQTFPQRLGKLFCGLILLVGASFMTARAALSVNDYFASEHWPTAVGTVVKNDVTKSVLRLKGIPITSYRPTVSYVYRIGPLTIQNDTIRFGEKVTLSNGTRRSTARSLADRFPVGSAVTVLHDPNDPTNAVLERHVDFAAILTLLGMLAAALLGLRLLLLGVTSFATETATPWWFLMRRWHRADVVLLVLSIGCGLWQLLLMPLIV